MRLTLKITSILQQESVFNSNVSKKGPSAPENQFDVISNKTKVITRKVHL